MSAEATSNTILCAGRLYCDLIFTGAPNLPSMGTETFSDGLSLHAGGGAFITSAAFSALGWNAALLATLPASPFDSLVCDEIAAFGVNTNYCTPAPKGSAPQLTVAITGRDDRAFLSHKTGKALPDIKIPEGEFRHLHIGELRSLVEHPDLITKARDAGMTISVDCGWDAELLAQGRKMADLLSLIDIFLPNEVEYDHLLRSGLTEGSTPLTVVKCGGDGAKALEEGIWTHQPTLKTSVIDATGAGDAFNGGFLSSWLSGKPLDECLANGNQCGRYSVAHTGGTGGLLTLQSDLDAAQAGAAQ